MSEPTVNEAWPAANPPSLERARELAESLDGAQVRAAAERISGRVRRTPVLRSPEIDAIAGCEVWFKAENLQHIGAFKARGALHAIGRIPPDIRQRGVLTYSSGNHAQAVALAAQVFGVPAHICMPEDAPPIKAASVRRMGATVQLAGFTSEDRKSACLEAAAESGGIVIQPFDHPDIVLGAGTATLELRDQVRQACGAELDALIVPVGGGGVIAGACIASRDAKGRAFEVYSAEPARAATRWPAASKRVSAFAVEPGPYHRRRTQARPRRPAQLRDRQARPQRLPAGRRRSLGSSFLSHLDPHQDPGRAFRSRRPRRLVARQVPRPARGQETRRGHADRRQPSAGFGRGADRQVRRRGLMRVQALPLGLGLVLALGCESKTSAPPAPTPTDQPAAEAPAEAEDAAPTQEVAKSDQEPAERTHTVVFGDRTSQGYLLLIDPTKLSAAPTRDALDGLVRREFGKAAEAGELALLRQLIATEPHDTQLDPAELNFDDPEALAKAVENSDSAREGDLLGLHIKLFDRAKEPGLVPSGSARRSHRQPRPQRG